MGLKPLMNQHPTNPFTTRLPDGQEVNGNRDSHFQISYSFIAVSFTGFVRM